MISPKTGIVLYMSLFEDNYNMLQTSLELFQTTRSSVTFIYLPSTRNALSILENSNFKTKEELNAFALENNITFTIINPVPGADIYAAVNSNNSDIVALDYISIMEVDRQNQIKELLNILNRIHSHDKLILIHCRFDSPVTENEMKTLHSCNNIMSVVQRAKVGNENNNS